MHTREATQSCTHQYRLGLCIIHNRHDEREKSIVEQCSLYSGEVHVKGTELLETKTNAAKRSWRCTHTSLECSAMIALRARSTTARISGA